MARLPALVDAVTALDRRPRGAIDHVARVIREEGFIQTTKRGRGASDMTPRDAAALVLGLYGSSDAAGAAAAIAQIAALPRRGAGIDLHRLPAEFRAIATSATAVDAVACLIELAPNIRPLTGRRPVGSGTRNPILANVRLDRPSPQVQITLKWADGGVEGEFELRYSHNRGPGYGPYDVVTHLRETMFIELHRTLFPMAAEPSWRD